MRSICLMLTLMLLTAGCGKKPGTIQSGMQPNALLASANSINTAGVQMVIYQAAGYGHLPMPQQQPLRGLPREITRKDDVRLIVDALNNPDGKAFTRMARNNRLAVVGQNGQVVMYGIGGSVIQGCDITAHESSSKLTPALRTAMAQARVVRLTLASPVKSVSYHDTGSNKQPAQVTVTKNQTLLQELLKCYSPLVLKGNRRCGAREAQDYAKRVPHFLTVKLVKPDVIDAIVATKETEWPPEVYDTSARLDRVKFDTITVFHEGNGLVRLIFTDSKGSECLFTDPVNSLRLLKEAHGRNPPVYGPDLFNDLVSALSNS